MNPLPELSPYLKQLRLSGILDSLEARNRQAIDGKLAYTEFLALLIQDEVARREQKKFELRMRRATFRATKTLEQFDFERLPKLNRALVNELATGRYLSERAPALIVGPCGTVNPTSHKRSATALCVRVPMCSSQPALSSPQALMLPAPPVATSVTSPASRASSSSSSMTRTQAPASAS